MKKLLIRYQMSLLLAAMLTLSAFAQEHDIEGGGQGQGQGQGMMGQGQQGDMQTIHSLLITTQNHARSENYRRH